MTIISSHLVTIISSHLAITVGEPSVTATAMADHHHLEVTVLYFAAASTATGKSSETIRIPDSGINLSDLGELLISQHPGTALSTVLKTSQWSVDAEMIVDSVDFILRGGEEVAVICPVSGG